MWLKNLAFILLLLLALFSTHCGEKRNPCTDGTCPEKHACLKSPSEEAKYCYPECLRDEECLSGELCSKRGPGYVCFPEQATPPPPEGYKPDGGSGIGDGKGGCQKNDDCKRGQYCEKGDCIKRICTSGLLEINLKCAENERPSCLTRVCVSCQSDAECKAVRYEACESGACLPCTKDSCKAGEKCGIDGCEKACQKDTDCKKEPLKPVCDDITKTCVQCSINKECEKNQICERGICLNPKK